MIAEIESAILNALNPLTEEFDLQVSAFPDSAQSLGKPKSKGLILIGYKGDSLDPPTSPLNSEAIIQNQIIEYEVSLQLKSLRSHTGAYPVMTRIQDLLTGLRPVGYQSQPIYKSKGGFIDVADGIWYYSMLFCVNLKYLKT